MEWREETVTDYHCVKCRNNVAVVRKINLAKGILPDLLIRGGGKYRFVTCSLCGYTEMYDLSIYAKNAFPKPCEDKSADLAPGT
jgi:predicted nucleic-acid-binding Zn-ribbon protein